MYSNSVVLVLIKFILIVTSNLNRRCVIRATQAPDRATPNFYQLMSDKKLQLFIAIITDFGFENKI